MNNPIRALALLSLCFLVGCTSLGGHFETGREGARTASMTWGPTSLLGDLDVQDYELRKGDLLIKFRTGATKNPSDNVVKIVDRYFMFQGAKFLIKSWTDLEGLRINAAHAEKLTEFDLAAQQQGFSHELDMAKQAQAAAEAVQ